MRAWFVGVALLSTTFWLGLPAYARPLIHNSTEHRQQASGDLRAYSYLTGTNQIWDSDTDWASGSYQGTQTAVGSGSVTLSSATSGNWWDSDWASRRCFTVTNPAGYALAAHPVLLSFDAAADLAAGRLASGAADLRAVTGGASATPLPFDLVGPWPSATAQVWVKVPALAAGASTTACLYFNNPAAAALPANPAARYDPLYRVRGGATNTIADPARNWVPDSPAPTGMTLNTGNSFTNVQPLPLDSSVPAGTPAALFYTERWDDPGNPEMRYRFAVNSGRPVRVRILAAEIFFTSVGQRIFSVNIEGGAQEITKLDAYATCLARGLPGVCGLGFDFAYPSSIDGFIDIDFLHVTQNPKVSAIEILDETVLNASGGGLENQSTSGTWTSAVIDTGAAGVFGLTSATLTQPAGSTLSYRVATSTSPLGPWQYVGPDGTAATSFSGTPQPLGYAADERRYFRVQADFTSSGTSPSLTQLRLGHSLPELSRSSGGQFLATASSGTGQKWILRLRSKETSVEAGTARLVVASTSVWGSASLTGAFDAPEVICCGPTQFSVASGTLTASPTAVNVPLSGGMSIALTRTNTNPATADLVARFALSGTARVEIPVRITLP